MTRRQRIGLIGVIIGTAYLCVAILEILITDAISPYGTFVGVLGFFCLLLGTINLVAE